VCVHMHVCVCVCVNWCALMKRACGVSQVCKGVCMCLVQEGMRMRAPGSAALQSTNV